MVGKRYNKLVVKRVYRGNRSVIYCDCICDCGKECCGKRAVDVLGGFSKSCGCERYSRRGKSIDGGIDFGVKYAGLVERVDSGESVSDVARDYGVSRQTVYKVYERLSGGR